LKTSAARTKSDSTRGDRRYYTASNRNCKTTAPCPTAADQAAVLGVIDGTSVLIETVPQSSGSHSVAADSKRNLIFVPQSAPVAVVGAGGDTTDVGARGFAAAPTGVSVSTSMMSTRTRTITTGIGTGIGDSVRSERTRAGCLPALVFAPDVAIRERQWSVQRPGCTNCPPEPPSRPIVPLFLKFDFSD
jgi:hypothetical protein